MKNVLTFIFFIVLPSTSTHAQVPTCNGYSELCARRYNQVAYAGTHNATSLSPSPVSNQDKTITEQLNAGIRSMKIPVHIDTHKNKRTLMACHGMYRNVLYTNYVNRITGKAPKGKISQTLAKGAKKVFSTPYEAALDQLKKLYGTSDVDSKIDFHPCILDFAKKPLVEVLSDIKKFMDKNPDAVVTITIEDGTGNLNTPQSIADAFIESGLHIYTHGQDVQKEWPFLSDMISSGKRLVVFFTSNTKYITPAFKASYPWLNRQGDFVWKYTYPYGSFDKMKKGIEKNDFTVRSPDNFNARHQPPYNKVFLVGHAVTPALAGNKKDAAKANKRDFLINMLNRMINLSGSMPNLIEIDFFQVPNNDIFDVVNHLNGVGKYKGKPLRDFKFQ